MPEFSTLALVDRATFDGLLADIGHASARELVVMFFSEAETRLAALRGFTAGEVTRSASSPTRCMAPAACSG